MLRTYDEELRIYLNCILNNTTMNKQLLFLAVLAFSTVNAQNKMTDKEAAKHMKEVQKSKDKGTSIWDWDTVYNNGIPYCIIYEVEKGAFHHNDYSVRSLTGQELIYVKYDIYTDYAAAQPNSPAPQSGYYQYIFSDTKAVAELLMNRPFKEIVRNNLIDNGTTINSAAETAFLALYPRKYSQMAPPPMVAPPVLVVDYTPVPRNRNGGLMILLNNISQDNVTIGNIQSSQSNYNGVITTTLNIFLPNGTKVAVATNEGLNSHVWNMITMKNNAQIRITSSNGQDNMDIIKYLINGYYL
jgi:hypothetical protein